MAKIDIKPSFGSVLRYARMRIGQSREQVACVAGVDQSYLARCEKGLVEPTFNRAVAMLWAVGVRLRIVPGERLRALHEDFSRLNCVEFDFSRGFEFDPSTYSENPDND